MGSIEVRDLRSGHWFWLDNSLIDEYGATIGAYGIAVYAVLARHANRERECWPSLKRIAAMIGCSKTTVLKALKRLETEGLIRKERIESDEGDYSHNRYCLLNVNKKEGVVQQMHHLVQQVYQGSTAGGHEQDPLNNMLMGSWNTVLEDLSLQMTNGTFDRWLRDSQLTHLDDGAATVEVRDEYCVDWCGSRLRIPIERTLAGVLGHDTHIIFAVKGENDDGGTQG